MNQTSQHRSYKLLQFIYISVKSFYIIIIDFILILSKTIVKEDYIMLIIDKFNKIITFIVDKTR